MKRTWLSLVVLIGLLLIVASCGAAQAPVAKDSTSSEVAPRPVATRAASAPAPAPAAGLGATKESLSPSVAPDVLQSSDIDRLIIRTGNLVLIVKDVAARAEQAAQIAKDAGGQVLRTDSRYQGEDLYSTVVIKVPAEAYDDVLAKLRRLAVRVDSENTSTQDVTEEFVDLDARLKVLDAQQQQLLAFLQRTQSVDESLKVYRELTSIQSQIESIKGRMNYLQKSAAMSTISINLRPEESNKPIVPQQGWEPLSVVRNALRALVSLLQSLFGAAIYALLVIVPIIVLIVVPLLIIRAIWRRVRRRKAN